MAAPPLSPQLFSILAALVEERCGIAYDPGDAALVSERLGLRAQERGFESLLDYYYFLRYDPGGSEELDALVEELVVQETYLFRELPQLRVLVEEKLEPAVRRGERPRVWCAAAATGEEPITLALLLAERDLLGRVELLASDISERALAQARRGEFGRRSLRALVPGYERWLTVSGERASVALAILRAIEWRTVNLVDRAAIARLGSFDAIVCRNVFIYFRDDTVRRVVDDLAARLAPGGVLLVGVSESLLRLGTLLRCEERRGVFFYEKAA